jgi:hypothetical protein
MSCFIQFQGLGFMTATSRAPHLFAQLAAVQESLLPVDNSQLSTSAHARTNPLKINSPIHHPVSVPSPRGVGESDTY